MLTERQLRFCQEYFRDPSSCAAATIKAGYASKHAAKAGYKLLQNPNIRAEIARLRQAAEDASIMGVQEACQILTAIARSNVPDYYGEDGVIDIRNGDPRAIEQVKQAFDQDGTPTRTLKLTSKVTAIERLAKLLGWDAPEKSESTTTIIEIRDPDGWGSGDYTEPEHESED